MSQIPESDTLITLRGAAPAIATDSVGGFFVPSHPTPADDSRHEEVSVDDMMTRREAAEFLRVKWTWLRDNAGRPGYPPVYKVGRYVRYSRTDLEAWLRLNRVG